MDNFLVPGACERVRSQLVDHWGWRHKDWSSEHLHNHRPALRDIQVLIEELDARAAALLGGCVYSDHWVLMYPRNSPGRIHVDNASLSLTVWLTDERYNLNPRTGGLVLYDVARPDDMRVDERYTPLEAPKYVSQRTKGRAITIPYKANRAILFDAALFHCTDRPRFDCQSSDGYRVNLSIAYDRL